jgi:serine/threonine-protein kinase
MAEVHSARVLSGPRQGQVVALKRLLPHLARDSQSVSRFFREAELTRALDHPHVVRTLDVGQHEGVSFLVMEFVDGRDLGQILRRCRLQTLSLPVDFGVFLARTLLEALAYAHNARRPGGELLELVHCDVSPSNVFISRTGEIKLGDFGVARARIGHSEPQEVEGKPYYLSPEVLAGQLSADADLWAANVVLYELLTLERPFVGRQPEEVMEAVRSRRYVSVRDHRPEIPIALSALVDRGFAEKPEQRFGTAARFAAKLQGHFDERIGTPLAIAAVVRGLFGPEG